jgi:predicted ArsR family transcriptional regulator
MQASCLIDAKTARARVLAALQANPAGLTRQELESELHMDGNTIRPRVAELMARGLIRPSGEIRRTASGRASEVLEVAS